LPEDVLQEGDLLFNTRNTLELVGKVAVWKNELPKALYNSNLMKMTFDNKKVYSNYFMNYVFNSNVGIRQLRRVATGTTSVGAIYTKDLLKFKVALPPLPEQQKISEILSRVDKKIEVIGEQISQTQELKRGLMQRLLTKGIGHSRFKDSPLGKIPESWEEITVGDILDLVNGKAFKPSDWENEGLPIIRIQNLKMERLSLITLTGK
jgi:type I restriction enzyme S subunit